MGGDRRARTGPGQWSRVVPTQLHRPACLSARLNLQASDGSQAGQGRQEVRAGPENPMARLEGDLHALRGIARKGGELVGKVVVNAATIAQAHQFLHGAVRLGDIDFGLERRSHRSLFVSTKRSNKLAKLGCRGARKGPAKHTSPFQLARSRAPDQIRGRELRLRAGMPRRTGASSIMNDLNHVYFEKR